MRILWSIPDIQKKDKDAVKKVLQSDWFSMGEKVKEFEKKVASYLDIDYAVAVNSGTSALDVALKCLNIKKDDEIIIPAFTYIATGNAVLYNNGTPVFVDIDETLNINPDLIEEKITDKTKAIMNIDLGGNPSNYSKLIKIAKKHNLFLIVDGAQSFGSVYHDVKCCTHGIINTTSFHAAKILTTIEGGMLFTREKKFYDKAKAIRNQGETSKYFHPYLGHNYRMTDLTAALGVSQLERIKETLETRFSKAEYYQEHLENVEYPKQLLDTVNSYFFFLILVENRDRMNKYLNKNGIDTRITYPMPLNEQPVFRKFSKDEVFPVAKEVSQKIISLPIYHQLTQSEQDFIIKKINTFRG